MNKSKKIERRQFLQGLGAISLSAPALGALTACDSRVGYSTKKQPTPPQNETPPPVLENDVLIPSQDYSSGKIFKPGYLSIIQGPTSDSIAMINAFVPKLKDYFITVVDPEGNQYPVEKYLRVDGPTHSHVQKIKVSGLKPGVKYTLNINDKTRKGEVGGLIDRRTFGTLDLEKKQPRFGYLSCMADDYRFDGVIDPMWNKLKSQDVDFLVLSGDLVYVDSFETVERLKATEFDIWQRYIDALKRIPVYHWSELKPILATWDDHDYGTNDGNRDFIGRDPAKRLFHALYFGQQIESVWSMGPGGTSSLFEAFGQKFIFMDDRSFRQPNKDRKTVPPPPYTPESYGHWGKDQHDWLIKVLSQCDKPAWIFNGNQFFRGAPEKVTYVESLQYDSPVEFADFTNELKSIKAPVVFASGDVHLSEIMQIPAETIGFNSYEFTSSSMHSYIGGDGPWDNSLRLPGMVATEFNFMVITSEHVIPVAGKSGFKIDAKSIGLAKTPYFEGSFEVSR